MSEVVSRENRVMVKREERENKERAKVKSDKEKGREKTEIIYIFVLC